MSLNKVLDVIEHNDNFLITSHIDPEGDALGSQLALAQILKAKKKKFIIANHSPIPAQYRFLPCSEVNKKPSKQFKIKVVLVVDCPELKRIGKVAQRLNSDYLIVNIDHHISNKRFGDINWVEPDASCAAEMIYNLYQCFNLKLNKKIALCLYAGLVTDTGSFHYSNTTAQTHRIVSQLLKFDINPAWVYEKVYENISIRDIRLLSLVLKTIKIDSTKKIAWAELTQKMLKATKTKLKESEGFMSHIRALKGVKVAIFFKETDEKGKIKVSLRSKGDIDVNKIAQFFGGGGHKAASGLSLKGSLSKAKRLVLKQARKMV